uniref:Uncharacterized protein n=1 Tax=Anguilla anguilla TaxID=7936 RepID=A0A0E9TY22_ANGAN
MNSELQQHSQHSVEVEDVG